MFTTIASGALQGVDSFLVQVEVSITAGLPCFEMVGFLGSEVREARERVRVALHNTGYIIPRKRITINLSPANIRKEGSSFDLPIAIGILTSLGIIPNEELKEVLLVGELGLNGEVKSVVGILPTVLLAKEKGYQICFVPSENIKEAQVVKGIQIVGINNITEVIIYLTGTTVDKDKLKEKTRIYCQKNSKIKIDEKLADFQEINGQIAVKRATEIAAAGFHHVLIVGSPGSGKTMIAKRIPTILPPLSYHESLEVTKIYSIAGLLEHQGLLTKRPFWSPHHTITEKALAGGSRIPKPGIVSLAHRGVLFLDELPEFKRSTLEILRQPIEEHKIQIARSHGIITYPAHCMIVGAMNPCPCGYYPNPNKCSCKEYQVKRYIDKISGPLLDRIDIVVEAPPITMTDLNSHKQNETSEQIRNRVMKAREIQEKRYINTTYLFNSEIDVKDIKKYCFLGEAEQKFMESLFDMLELSARSYHRMIKVARTIADLEGEELIRERHLAEAACYRGMLKND